MDPHFAAYMKTIYEIYGDVTKDRGDSGMKEWPLMGNPIPTVLICLSYIYFCKAIGPKLMKNRNPFQLGYGLVWYNVAQVSLNAWIFYEYLQSGWFNQYTSSCKPVDSSGDETAKRLANACWWYFISKFAEMMDTMTYFLRKQLHLVTDVHVVHHGLMPISVWAGMKFAPGNQSVFFALVNSFVHIVMYLYYMLEAIGSNNQQIVLLKKYITCLQVAQFLLVVGHQFQFASSGCHYSRGFLIWIMLHGIFFFLIFSNFYSKKLYLQENFNTAMRPAPLLDRRDRYVVKPKGVRVPRREIREDQNFDMSTRPFSLTEELPSYEKEE